MDDEKLAGAETPIAALLFVDDNEDDLLTVSREAEQRYGAHYRVVTAGSRAEAANAAGALQAADLDVALIAVENDIEGGAGLPLLEDLARVHPHAKRCLIVRWGDRSTADAIMHATSIGAVDDVIPKPWQRGDELFHRSLTDLLAAWGAVNRPQFEAVRIVAEASDPHAAAMRDALYRSGVSYGFYEADSREGAALLRRVEYSGPLPIGVLHDGRVLVRPNAAMVASALGVNTRVDDSLYDVVVVGAGPGGLAAAVYGSSEGLNTLLVDAEAIGGQAGTSSLIRNYLGFPRGLSGTDLATRAYQQAWLFGTQMLIGRRAVSLASVSDERHVVLDDGVTVRGRTVVLATGVSYRRLDVPGVERLVGRGVFYGAAATEARTMAGEHVFVVGGANSAGQAALHLAKYADRVTLLVRGTSIAESMSAYLIRQMKAAKNIEVRTRTEVAGADGDLRLECISLRTGDEIDRVSAAGLFILIGAVPRTDWLPEAIKRDERGFILTGTADEGRYQPQSLETTMAGVYAVGDVRAGSVKRVASAVGEGSIAIRMVHEYMAAKPVAGSSS